MIYFYLLCSISYGEKGMSAIDRAIGQLFRSLEVHDGSQPRPRRRTQLTAQSPLDLKPEYTQRIGGLSLTDFKLLVLIPATIIRLIQADEESRVGICPTFEEAVDISKTTGKVGELLYPDDDDEGDMPLSVEYVAARLFEDEESGKGDDEV